MPYGIGIFLQKSRGEIITMLELTYDCDKHEHDYAIKKNKKEKKSCMDFLQSYQVKHGENVFIMKDNIVVT